MADFKPLAVKAPTIAVGNRVRAGNRYGTVEAIDVLAPGTLVTVRFDDMPERPTQHKLMTLRKVGR